MLKLSELKISPAPWDTKPLVHLDDGSPAGLYVTDASGSDVCVDIDGVSLTQQEANARIIAAVPEMYDAVQRYISADDEMNGVDVNEALIERRKIAFRDMRAALAKAAGESEVK